MCKSANKLCLRAFFAQKYRNSKEKSLEIDDSTASGVRFSPAWSCIFPSIEQVKNCVEHGRKGVGCFCGCPVLK